MADELLGKKIAFLATDGVEESELSQPWDKIRNAGAEVFLVSLKLGEIQAVAHDKKTQKFAVDIVVTDTTSKEFDGLVLPGGVMNPDALRLSKEAVSFVKSFFDEMKPVAAICHGPWMLVEADVLKGRSVTSWPSLKTDIVNAGGKWSDQQVVTDRGLVTSRKPDDLDAFCRKAIEEFAEGIHRKKAA